MTTATGSDEPDDGTFAAFLGGSEEAASRLVDACLPRLFHFARLRAPSREAAEDAIQEAFVELIRQRHSIESPQRVTAWLFTLVRRKLARHYDRGAGKHETAAGDRLPEGVAGATQRHGILDDQRWQWLDKALADADENEREAIVLKYFCGMKVREIAAALAIPEGTVGTRLARGLRRLREWFDAQGLAPEDLLHE